MQMSANSMPAAIGFVAGIFFCGSAGAADYVCADVAIVRKDAQAKEAVALPFGKEVRLHLSINEQMPERSTMRWTGDRQLEGVTSQWPPGTRLLHVSGVLAASISASADGISSVGTFTLDAQGNLRITESTVLPETVIFDVTEATCRPEGG